MKKRLLTLFVIAALSACGQAKSDAKAPHTSNAHAIKKAEMQVTHVNAQEAYALLKAKPDVVILDVRTPGEFASGHIDGAVNIDFKNANFANEIAKLDGSKEYLVHCRSGGRSTRSLKQFKSAGFTNIDHLDGGIIAWNKAGLETVK